MARTVNDEIQRLNDSSAWVRQSACLALGRIRDQQAIAPLVGKLYDPEPMVRHAAGKALVLIGPPSVPALIQVAGSGPDSLTTRIVCRALGRLRDNSASGVLITLLGNFDQTIRAASKGALIQLGEKILAI